MSSEVTYSYDKLGNIIITYNDKYFTFFASETLEIFSIINYQKFVKETVPTKNKKIIKMYSSSALAEKINDDENDENDEKYKFPEDDYIFIEQNKNSNLDEDSENFTFFGNFINNSLLSLNNLANYEFLIIEGDNESTNVVFRSELNGSEAINRITYYTSGCLLYHRIGYKTQRYNIKKSEDGLNLILFG